MRIKIDPTIFAKYPNVVLGVAAVAGVNNAGDSPEIQPLLREAEQNAIGKIKNIPLIEHPHVSPWREAYRLFGAKPKKYPSSIENLLRRVSGGEQVRHINKLVDIYNIISLKHLVPVGGEDLEKIEGDVSLTFAGDNEASVKLLGDPEARPPYPAEVIYKDNVGTICRRWNWKEADRTKLTESTKDAVIVIEGLPPVGKKEIQEALNELHDLVTKFCGGQVVISILNKDEQETTLK